MDMLKSGIKFTLTKLDIMEILEKLSKVIPNKITDTMGIVVGVNLLYEGDNRYIEISVDKFSLHISYHGNIFIVSAAL